MNKNEAKQIDNKKSNLGKILAIMHIYKAKERAISKVFKVLAINPWCRHMMFSHQELSKNF
ncbi:hypothetical protein RLOatenuis_3750 [Rickettsiales bacterium]|nr:hypothetical protein RLOatenuis_3750 [Rickettsiales bacterium]